MIKDFTQIDNMLDSSDIELKILALDIIFNDINSTFGECYYIQKGRPLNYKHSLKLAFDNLKVNARWSNRTGSLARYIYNKAYNPNYSDMGYNFKLITMPSNIFI